MKINMPFLIEQNAIYSQSRSLHLPQRFRRGSDTSNVVHFILKFRRAVGMQDIVKPNVGFTRVRVRHIPRVPRIDGLRKAGNQTPIEGRHPLPLHVAEVGIEIRACFSSHILGANNRLFVSLQAVDSRRERV